MIEFGDYFKQFLVRILSNFHLFLNIFIAVLTKTGISGDFFMLKHIFILFIKRLSLVFLLIIQTSAFSLNPHLPTASPEQWAICAPNNEQTIIYNENSILHLKAAEQPCTMIVVGNHTHLIIHSDNTHLLSVPMNVENGWLYLGGEKSLNL